MPAGIRHYRQRVQCMNEPSLPCSFLALVTRGMSNVTSKMASPKSETTDESSELLIAHQKSLKEKYLKIIEQNTEKTLVNLCNPWTRGMIGHIVKVWLDVQEAKTKPKQRKPGKVSLRVRTCVMSKYQVVTDKRKPVLYLKDSTTKSLKEVICQEDSFEILLESHLNTKHGGYKDMLSDIQSKYFMNPQNISWFLPLCEECNGKNIPQRIGEPVFYDSFIIDLTEFPDDVYNYVLVMVDKSISFFLLRPLATTENTELAIEFVKIFSDLGPPSTIKTCETDFFLSAIDIASKTCSDFNVKIETEIKSSFAKYEEVVMYELRNWIQATCSTNWAIGCRMVQWQLNNTLFYEVTPFQALFGELPHHSLRPNVTPNKDVDKTVVESLIEKFNTIYGLDKNKHNQPHAIEKLGAKILVEPPDDKEGNLPTSANAVKCHVCHHHILRVYDCNKCQKPMHLLCGVGQRKLDKNKIVNISCPFCSDK